MATRVKKPESPLTGLYFVRNSSACNIFRGDWKACQAFEKSYQAGRDARRLPKDQTEIVPETLWVEAQTVWTLLKRGWDKTFRFRVSSAQPTGKRRKGWWGGMEGGHAMFEEWEAVIQSDDSQYNGLRVFCIRKGTSELDFNRVPSTDLEAVEIA